MASYACFLALVITILTVGFAESVSDTCQGDTIYSERGSRLEVQCDITAEFIAVFWFRGTDEDNGQLILSNDHQLKTVKSEGYNITDEGAMVINELQIEHGGPYWVRYRDKSGNPFDKTVSIYVKVSLRSNPSIEACGSSSHEICRSIEVNKLQNTLLCIAEETRPPVNLTWNALNGEEYPSWYNNTLNITSLYTSTSLLKYNPKDFNLEYFTCNVTGMAVQEPRPVGMFVKGSNEDGVDKQEVQFLKSGADLILECPKNELGEWGVRYPNGTYDLLWRNYPEYEGGSCLDTDRCEVEEDGTLVVNKVTFRDEGDYMCFSRTDQSDRIVEYPVEVHVSPPLMKTVIKGCEDVDNCELNVANKGSLECSIFGSRPSIKPVITAATTVTDKEIFIFGHTYTEEESSQPGTVDTKLYVEYTIPDCSEVVSIECTPGNNEHEDNIAKSVVNLITATSGCGEESGGRPGLVVFLVLFFLILVIIAIIVFYLKREYIFEKLPPHWPFSTSGKTEDQELGIRISETGADEKTKYLVKLENEKPIPTIENKPTSADETDCLQNKFNNSFKPISSGIIAKTTTPEEFKDMMKSFCSDNKVTIPIPFLAGYLKNKNVHNEQEVLKLLHFVVDNFQNDWVGHFLKMLEELLKPNRISSTNYITLVGKLLQRRVIGLLRYVESSGSLVSESIVGFDLIMNELKGLVDKRYCSKEDFLSTLLRYYLNNYISEDTIMKELFSETETYHYMTPYFLQSTYQEFQQTIDSQSINPLCKIFKSVWEKLMAKTIEMPIKLDNNSVGEKETQPSMGESGEMKQMSNEIRSRKLPDSADEKFEKDALNKILQQALIEAIIFSMDADMIKTYECVEMIQNSKVSQEVVEKHVSSYTVNSKVSSDHGIKLLEQTIIKKMISDEIFIEELWHFVTPKRKITFDEYMGKLKDFLRQKLLSDRCFEQKVTNLINGGETKKEKEKREKKEKKERKKNKTKEGETFLTTKSENEWDHGRWIKFVTELANEDLIGKSSWTTLYQCVVTYHKMKRDDFHKMLKLHMKIEKNIREGLIRNMKF